MLHGRSIGMTCESRAGKYAARGCRSCSENLSACRLHGWSAEQRIATALPAGGRSDFSQRGVDRRSRRRCRLQLYRFTLRGKPYAQPGNTFRRPAGCQMTARRFAGPLDEIPLRRPPQGRQCNARGFRIRGAVTPEGAIGTMIPAPIRAYPRREKLSAFMHTVSQSAVLARESARARKQGSPVTWGSPTQRAGNHGQPSG